MAVRGRTPVHEMGHYLGLRHIWGDGDVLGPNNCDQSDGIDDTPYASTQSGFDCNKSKNSCTRIESFYGADVPDLVENFMDYASEDCMNMFTEGQVELMRNVLLGPRGSLLADPTAVKNPDIASPLSIFPNPAHDQLTILIPDQDGSNTRVRLMDINGKVLIDQPYFFRETTLSMDLTGFQPGIYWVQILTSNRTYSAKVVIQ
jgi:hypothetical protein